MHDTDRQGSPGPVDDASLVADLSSADLDPALANLVEELTGRLQAGDSVDAEEIAAQYPELAVPIRQLFPALLSIAAVGRISNDESLPGLTGPDGERRFGEFAIDRELGRGGMGVVYEARQDPIGRRVALKILPPAAALDQRALKRFQLEAQVAGLLQHPGIVPVYAVGTQGGVPYYAMRYIEGRSLAELLSEIRELSSDPEPRSEARLARSPGPLTSGLLAGRFARRGAGSGLDASPPAEASSDDPPASPSVGSSVRGRAFIRTIARLGIEAAEALAFAHEQGVVHRDVKPANLLLDADGHLWVADFGMADVQGDAGLTLTGDLPGTLRYMSPEQALGKRSLVDRRSDVYALGATLFELLTLRPAVSGGDRQEILRGLAEAEPPPARRLNPAVPVDLETIVAKCLAKDPAARYETARHLADDLGRFLDGRPIAARPVGLPARAWRWCRRKPALAALATSLALAIAVGFAGITWNWREAVRQRSLADRERDHKESQRAKADAINHFLTKKLLLQAAPEHNPGSRGVTLREALDRAAAEVGDSFKDHPTTEAAIRLTLGQTYHELGEYVRSESHLRRAYELSDTGTDAERIEAITELGHILYHLERPAEGIVLLERAAEEGRRSLGKGHDTSLMSSRYLAESYGKLGRISEAEALLRRILEDIRLVGRSPSCIESLNAMTDLGRLLAMQRRYPEARRLLRECLELKRTAIGNDHPDTLTSQHILADALFADGRHEEAESHVREAFNARSRVLGPDHPFTRRSQILLADVLTAQGRREEAEELLRFRTENRPRDLGGSHPDAPSEENRRDQPNGNPTAQKSR